jgi:hypothetical protein
VRIQERTGSSTTARIESKILGVDESVTLATWQIKTLLIRKSMTESSGAQAVSLLESRV